MKTSDSISVPSFAIAYSSIAADTDLVAAGNARLVTLGKMYSVAGARRLYIGTSAANAGTIAVSYADDPTTAITFSNVAQGSYLTGLFSKIYVSGTTVTNIIAEF